MHLVDVLVVGGGYAGTMCALRLAGVGKGCLKVAVINPRDMFVERLRMHEALVVAPKYELRSFAFGEFLNRRGIDFFRGSVVSLDRAAKTLQIRGDEYGETKIGYLTLVVASGSISTSVGISGQGEHSFAMNQDGRWNAQALAHKLKACKNPRISVIGGGATGIEVAAEIAQKSGASVTLVSRSALGEGLTDAVLLRVRKTLAKMGVRVIEHELAKMIYSDRVETNTQTIPHDLCVTATGFAVDPIWAKAGLATLPNGRIRTDPYLRTLSDPNIFAAGDASFCQPKRSAPPRMSVMYAMTSGAHVANAILDIWANRVPRRFAFWTYGQAIGLGPYAVGFGNMRLDRAYPPYFVGLSGRHRAPSICDILLSHLFLG